MLSFFRRKKPQDAATPDAPKTQHYSADELAAAFPSAAPVKEAPAAPVATPASVEAATPAPAPVVAPE
ncbi:signal recognition particle-docking protein FtsY, partial [Stenotrophomonas sp. SPM]